MIEPYEINTSRAKTTLAMLAAHADGYAVDYLTMSWGCSVQWVRYRVTEARAYLRTPEGQKLNICIPRPTGDNGWRYAITNTDVSAPDKPSIVRSQIDDFKALYAMSVRIAEEKKVAYNALPSKKSAKARQYKVEWSRAIADATYYEDQMQTLIERSALPV